MAEQLSPLGRFERLLLATDGSEFSTSAERLSLDLAERWGARLWVVSVVLTNPQVEVVAPGAVEAAEEESRAILARLREEAVKRGVAVETVTRRGPDPHVEIAAVADEQRADAIVMARRGKRGLLRRMLGDATTRVVGAARCAVLMVPEGAEGWRRRILLATDGSRFADAAAVSAARIAALDRLPVTVVSIVRESFTAERAAQADEAATRIAGHLAERGLEVDRMVLRGDPGKLIPETAAAREADLIVMGTHGRTGWERVVVGSVTESVMNASTVPVMAVKL